MRLLDDVKIQGGRQVLKVGWPPGPVTKNFKWPRSNSGDPKQEFLSSPTDSDPPPLQYSNAWNRFESQPWGASLIFWNISFLVFTKIGQFFTMNNSPQFGILHGTVISNDWSFVRMCLMMPLLAEMLFMKNWNLTCSQKAHEHISWFHEGYFAIFFFSFSQSSIFVKLKAIGYSNVRVHDLRLNLEISQAKKLMIG